MKVYLVGGAVRDQLLGLPVTERDWVVVGATPEQMVALGYKPVGKNFPVFLHPQTHEEYALARTERKTAPGYKGFVFHADPNITLEADLQRRDLTINAMAFSPQENQLIDPYGGQLDLCNKILRHVSGAFVEDPVRILRVARFSARFGDFSIHPSTMQLMRTIVQRGEVQALVAERVWQELTKALAEAYPQRFFNVLSESGALAILFPEFQNNPLGFNALNRSVQHKLSSFARFAALCYPLSSDAIKRLCTRYRVSHDYRDLALLVSGLYPIYQELALSADADILALFEQSDAFRRSNRFEQFLKICAAIDSVGGWDKANELYHAWRMVASIDFAHLKRSDLSGEAAALAVHQARLDQLTSFRASGKPIEGSL